MTTLGWIFLLSSLTLVCGVTAWCYYQLLK